MGLYSKVIKRILDFTISILAMPFVIIIILVFGILIWAEDKGPVFYCAERLGYKGKTFKMIKLRSMKVNAPDIRNADGSTFNSASDSRVTKIGSFLRRTSIDETPQFINVLIGDMSIIGPRAHVTTHYKGYDNLNEQQKLRLTVKPGITGYCAAYYRNSINSDEKMKYDCYYAENVSFMLDMKIFLKTIKSVIKKENIYSN